MTAAALLDRIRGRGVDVRADGADLVVRAPRGTLDPADIHQLRSRKRELVALLQPSAVERFATVRGSEDDSPLQLLDRFLEDASIPLAVLHSRALDRDFVLARDAAVLEALSASEERLPVLTFADCEKLAGLGPADLSAVLDVRKAFGPSAELVSVGPRLG